MKLEWSGSERLPAASPFRGPSLTVVVLTLLQGIYLLANATPVHAGALDSALRAELTNLPHKKAVAGACVIELESGRTVFAYHADRAFIPASSAKVFVMASGLKVLGCEFEFQTRLATDGTNLYLIGDGDPALGDPKIHRQHGQTLTSDFEQWADALARAGLTSFPGDLVLDESIFDGLREHPSWETADLGKWYAAPVGALNFNDNCVDITVTPAARSGALVHVAVQPPCSLIEVVNRCRTGSSGKPTLNHPHDSHTYTISGRCNKRWPFGAVAFPDPGLLTADVLRTVLARRGIHVAGGTTRRRVRLADGTLPSSLSVVAIRVTPLSEVLKRAGKNSQNLFAECLLKRIGYQWARQGGISDPAGSWVLGSQAVSAMFAQAGLSLTDLVIADGSGLSRANRCTARQLTGILAWMHTQPEGALLRQNLAVAGVDGSLRKRLTELPGCVVGKTGTMRGVRTLAGYVQQDAAPVYAFAVLFNDYEGPSTPYKEMQDRFCRILIHKSRDDGDRTTRPPRRRECAAEGYFASSAICESSGLVKSRKYPDIYWTHNDSGNPAVLFAIRLDGKLIARIPVRNATNEDWEDIAIDDAGYLYVGDIGDNFKQYPHRVIYKIPEPDPFAAPVKPVEPERVWKYRYPQSRFDCESLFVRRNKLYIIPKVVHELPMLFRLEPARDDWLVPTPVGRIAVLGATAADVSPDGRRLAVLAYGRLSVFELGDEIGDLERARPKRAFFPPILQTEACAFDGPDVIVTAESREIIRVTADDLEASRRLVIKK